MDGHGSHVTLEVIKLAIAKGLDLLTFPSHTSHALQLLDITCFKPFKFSFRAYRDKWSFGHIGKAPSKEDLAQWISHALKRALSVKNVTKGFETTGIYPINASAMNSKMGPSGVYERTRAEPTNANCKGSLSESQSQFQLDQWEIQEIFNEVSEDYPSCEQYYVQVDGDEEQDCGQANGSATSSDEEGEVGHMQEERRRKEFLELLELPRIQLPPISRTKMEPRIDYHKSILLTQEQHLMDLEDLATKREEAAQEQRRRKLEKEASKKQRAQVCVEVAKSKKKHNELWSAKNVRTLGEKLHVAIRANAVVSCHIVPYCGVIPQLCKDNQRLAILRRRIKKMGEDTRSLPPL